MSGQESKRILGLLWFNLIYAPSSFGIPGSKEIIGTYASSTSYSLKVQYTQSLGGLNCDLSLDPKSEPSRSDVDMEMFWKKQATCEESLGRSISLHTRLVTKT
jgi:hypothetical protein